MIRWRWMLLVALLPACSPDPESICSNLVDECGGASEPCKSDGLAFETEALDAGCEVPFDDYLDCIDDAECSWRSDCTERRNALDGCIASSSE